MKIAELPLDKHKRYFESAFSVAISSNGAGRNSFKLGCVILKKKHIIAAGSNTAKTHPKLLPFTKFPFIHAESSAILSLGLDNCEHTILYVLRILRNGELAIAKPCESCNKLIKFVGIKRIYYTTSSGYEELIL